jgi:MFS family permease
MNMNTTLGVYLRDVHGTPESAYGLILSLNAAMVVFLQFPITRRIEDYPPMLMMALGSALYAIGFAMYGFISVYWLFLVAMVIITIGEMLVAPVSQAVVANLAPDDKRGRYMAVFGFSFGIPFGSWMGPIPRFCGTSPALSGSRPRPGSSGSTAKPVPRRPHRRPRLGSSPITSLVRPRVAGYPLKGEWRRAPRDW